MNFIEKKIKLVEIIKELNKRNFPYQIAAGILRKYGISGNGYPRFSTNVNSLKETVINTDNVNNCMKELGEYLVNFIKFSNKKITIFKLEEAELNLVDQALKQSFSSRIKENDFNISISEEPQRNYQFKTFFETDDSNYYYLNIDRNYFQRETITDEKRMNAVEGALHFQNSEEIFKVITYTKVWVTAFDFFKIDYKNSIIVLGQDLSTLVDKAQRNRDYADLTLLLADFLGIEVSDLKALDLKATLPKFEAEKVGRIIEHQFSTSNQQFNHSTKVSSSEDVREDSYYKLGTSTEKLDYFGVCKTYEKTDGTTNVTLTIRLPLKQYNASPLNPIYEAQIDDALSLQSFEYGISKIIRKLS